jgi:hypothetical protein
VAFEEDEANCGRCGLRCGTGQFCCQGKCINGPSGSGDPGIPGGQIVFPPPGGELCACASDCGPLSCCYMDCVDLDSDPSNCGACGNDCTLGGSLDMQCAGGQCRP